jgi:UDP-3-O-[3-hydroxymyristoyl] N-acetylglucosamine deacetylase
VILIQQTIRKSFTVTGIGIHTGQPCTVKLSPGPVNSGRVVIFPSGTRVVISPDSVVGKSRGTSVVAGNDELRTVEHFLAALWGCGISNLIIEVDGPEIPILDGSAKVWCERLWEADVVDQGVPWISWVAPFPSSTGILPVQSEEPSIHISPIDTFKVICYTDFPILGAHEVIYEYGKTNFMMEIAPARTFGFESELKQLQENGLAKGASLENALLISETGFYSPLRFPDEPARHKLLDLLGDLAAFGRPIQGCIEAFKPGHEMNIAFVKGLGERQLIID